MFYYEVPTIFRNHEMSENFSMKHSRFSSFMEFNSYDVACVFDIDIQTLLKEVSK